MENDVKGQGDSVRSEDPMPDNQSKLDTLWNWRNALESDDGRLKKIQSLEGQVAILDRAPDGRVTTVENRLRELFWVAWIGAGVATIFGVATYASARQLVDKALLSAGLPQATVAVAKFNEEHKKLLENESLLASSLAKAIEQPRYNTVSLTPTQGRKPILKIPNFCTVRVDLHTEENDFVQYWSILAWTHAPETHSPTDQMIKKSWFEVKPINAVASGVDFSIEGGQLMAFTTGDGKGRRLTLDGVYPLTSTAPGRSARGSCVCTPIYD